MSTATHNFDRLDELAAAQIEDEINRAEFMELESLLDDEVNRRRYLDCLVLHGEMLWEAARSEELEDSLTERKPEGPLSTPRSKSWLNRASRHPKVPAVAVALAVMVSLLLAMSVTPVSNWIAGDSKATPEESKPETKPEFVAKLSNWQNDVWADEHRPPLRDPRLEIGKRLVLTSGFAEITYFSGTKLVLEGPAELEVVGKRHCAILFGKLVGHCPDDESKGFTVMTPEADIEDLGTEFAVHVTRRGRAYVEVFDGKVSVADSATPMRFASVELGANSAAMVDRTEDNQSATIRTIAPDGRQFTRVIYRETFIDLADIVGGGDGLGTGRRDVGINPRDGQAAVPTVEHFTGENRYNRVADESNPHGMVDGVFVPHGGGATVQLTSAAHEYKEFVDASHKPWCSLINGLAAGDDGMLGGVNYYTERGRTTLGMNASMGITFDLAKIREHHTGASITRFSAMAGVNDRADSENGDVIFYVFIDGQLSQQTKTLTRGDVEQLSINIKSTNRYLTIVSTDGGDDEHYDRAMLGDPRLQVLRMENNATEVKSRTSP